MATLTQLPIPAFENKEPYERGGEWMVNVYGINAEGDYYTYHEESELNELGEVVPRIDEETKLVARWILEMETKTDDYGVTKPINNVWVRKLYNQHAGYKYVKVPAEPRLPALTSRLDMIGFCASLGISIGYHANNGFVINNRGFDGKPLYQGRPDTGYSRIPDNAYDTKAPATHRYGLDDVIALPTAGTGEEPPTSNLI